MEYNKRFVSLSYLVNMYFVAGGWDRIQYTNYHGVRSGRESVSKA